MRHHQGGSKVARHTQPAAAALLETLTHDVLERALAVLEGHGLTAERVEDHLVVMNRV